MTINKMTPVEGKNHNYITETSEFLENGALSSLGAAIVEGDATFEINGAMLQDSGFYKHSVSVCENVEGCDPVEIALFTTYTDSLNYIQSIINEVF